MRKAIYVTWQGYRITGTPRKWSKDHLTEDLHSTLCGLTIPGSMEVHGKEYGKGWDPCRKCSQFTSTWHRDRMKVTSNYDEIHQQVQEDSNENVDG